MSTVLIFLFRLLDMYFTYILRMPKILMGYYYRIFIFPKHLFIFNDELSSEFVYLRIIIKVDN